MSIFTANKSEEGKKSFESKSSSVYLSPFLPRTPQLFPITKHKSVWGALYTQTQAIQNMEINIFMHSK